MFSSRTKRSLQASVFLILLFCGYSTQCGPGPQAGSRIRRPRKRTPLVYKQHVPNVSENTIGASGQADGAITRGDPRFKNLVENHNDDIIFRDEERDGSDRIMSERCKEKLNILAVMVMNQWPGNPPEVPPVKIKVKEAWDDNYLHGENSLHYEGRAVDVGTNDRDRSKLGMLARLAKEAGFDWVFYESHGHVHCSVKSDSSVAISSGGCFTGESMVEIENRGSVAMIDLRLGDRVLSMSPTGTLEYSEVISFMDRDERGYAHFFTLITESGKSLTLTGKHLLYVIKQNSPFNVNEVEVRFAESVLEGEYLLLRDKDKIIATAIKSISVRTRRGIYAPLTAHGNIVVDDIVASCYAYIKSLTIAHSAFAPMRIYHDISQYFPSFSWLESNSVSNGSNSTELPTGVHWYSKVLYKIGTTLLSKDLLYVQ